MSRLLDQLNEPQRRAVKAATGPVLIIAGAGSGKTKVLTHRVAYLLEQKLARPEEIVAVTFTNKAAEEMRLRVGRLLGRASAVPFLGTFHSLAARWLRREAPALGYSANFTIFDTDDQLKVIKRVMQGGGLAGKRISPATVAAAIDRAKNEVMTPAMLREHADNEVALVAAQIYELYQQELKKHNAMDFGDLLFNLVTLFARSDSVRQYYQNRFRHILVDEYQDTNRAQYLMVKYLSEKNQNLCVVGDDWQSIYSWRGADIRNILSFERDFPRATVIRLEQNYRSTGHILDAAHGVMEKAEQKKEKRLWTDLGKGRKVQIYRASDERAEARYIGGEIVKLRGQNQKTTVAVLYRTNAQSRALEEALINRGIPYQVVGGVKFYERREIKDLLAYLTLIVNPQNRLALERAAGAPPRGIGEKSVDLIMQGISGREQIGAFIKLLDTFRAAARDLKLPDLIDEIAEKIDYREYLLSEPSTGGITGEERWENVQELKTVALKYAAKPAAEGELVKFLEEVALLSDIDTVKSANQVLLMTLHSAKGLEFDTVFMAGMEDGLCPHARSFTEAGGMEEERRLCYVGMTRAKKNLYLTHAYARKLYGGAQMNPPSSFFLDLPAASVEEVAGSARDGEVEYVEDDSQEPKGILDRILERFN